MVKRNKELEMEAMKELDKQDKKEGKPPSTVNSNDLKRQELEKEKAEIEFAIQMSLAAKEE